MRTNYEVVVIGGGIIGCSIAYYLAEAQMDVAVFDGGQIGNKTTKAAAGMLGAHSESDGDFSLFFPFARSSQAEYIRLKDELYELSGMDIGYRTGGILKLAFSERDKSNLDPLVKQPTVDWLDYETVKKMQPEISDTVIGAAYIADDVNVIPTSTCLAFAKSAQMLGASIFENCPVYDIKKNGNEYTVKTDNGEVRAKHIVLATGVYSNSLFQNLGISEKLKPVKGESIIVHHDKPFLEHTLFYEKSYIVPRNNGKVVIGATMIEDDWSDSISLQSVEVLLKHAKTMLPSSINWKIDSFTSGLRPTTFDGHPFIGRHPEDEQIFIACGHFRNGILLAPATGKMIRNLILKQEVNKEWIDAFRINRQEKVMI
ncbi:glycine oxidase ThiO [Bacillus sinesaloumensis]|uniref:glycine oxidase ThiO n=1 Tax=Litchfieldia sinesaloumensis TaxID=1926280 RepID=UPI00098865A0|nr:glycine oxidase ThiO [Bacillus sinesaloumensis]